MLRLIIFILVFSSFSYRLTGQGRVIQVGRTTPDLRRTEAGIDSIVKMIEMNIELSDTSNKMLLYNLEILRGLKQILNQSIELSNKNIKLSEDLVRISDQSKHSMLATQAFTEQLVILGNENKETQRSMNSLTESLVTFSKENAILSNRMVEIAEGNERTSRIMIAFTVAMFLLTSIQAFPIISNWISRKPFTNKVQYRPSALKVRDCK